MELENNGMKNNNQPYEIKIIVMKIKNHRYDKL